jgi:hypothetical protein
MVVYAHVANFPQCKAAPKWLDGKLNGVAPVGLPRESLLAFERIVRKQAREKCLRRSL